MSDAPHHNAAFINAIAEEGTKDEAVRYLQETWDSLCERRAELCEARARIRELEAEVAAAREARGVGELEFDHPYQLINRSPWFELKAHGITVATFNVQSWGSEDACIRAAWNHAYGEPVPVTVGEAARVLLALDTNGTRRAVYDACAGVVKVYKFDAVLSALAALEHTNSDN